MRSVFIFIFIIFFCSCKQNSEAEVKTAPAHSEHSVSKNTSDLNTTSETVDVSFEDENFTEVYMAYLDLKGAFVNTDVKSVSAKADEMLDLLQKKYKADDLAQSLQKIKSSSQIKEQRAAFEIVSKNFENHVGKNKIVSGTIFKQYCPMAFDGKGAYWLSDSKEVRNPYFGDVMLTCGVVDKEIQ